MRFHAKEAQECGLYENHFRLESPSEAKIGLDEVFHRRIERMLSATDPVITRLAKDSNMRGKPGRNLQ
jgi:hypothetical protein